MGGFAIKWKNKSRDYSPPRAPDQVPEAGQDSVPFAAWGRSLVRGDSARWWVTDPSDAVADGSTCTEASPCYTDPATSTKQMAFERNPSV